MRMADRQCVMCSDFVTSDQVQMKRHVAIVHGESTFSTLQCGICKEIYYDFDHFNEHIQGTPCSSECLMIIPVPLNEHLERAFISLVDQMMKSVIVQPAAAKKFIVQGTESPRPKNQNPSSSTTGLNPECCAHMEIPKIISVQFLANQGHSVEQIKPKNGVKNKISKAAMDLSEATNMAAAANSGEQEDDLEAILDREARKSVNIAKPTNQTLAIDQQKKASRNKLSIQDLRVQCHHIISKRSHDGRLTCSLCNASVVVRKHTTHVLGHIRSHLDTPLFCCKLCTFKSKHCSDIRKHLSDAHNAAFDKCVDKIENHVELFMRMVKQCFDHGRVSDGRSAKSIQTAQIKIALESLTNNRGSKEISDGDKPGHDLVQSSIIKQNGGRKKLKHKMSKADLRRHCRQIILKRHRKSRLTCSICKGSILALSKGAAHSQLALKHVQRHADPPLFMCTLCQHTSNNAWSMSIHLNGQHSEASDQYIDTTADRIEELMNLVTRCFDHGLRAAKSTGAYRIVHRLQRIKMLGAEDEADQTTNSKAQSTSTISAGLKHQIVGRQIHGSNGPNRINQKKPRYTMGREKQGGFSVTSKKNNLGARFDTEGSSKLLKTASTKPKAMKKQGIKQRKRSKIPARVLNARRVCMAKVNKFVKNGKLECRICSQKIALGQGSWKNDAPMLYIQAAIAHSNTRHLELCDDLFECPTCHDINKSRVSMHYHVKQCQNGGQFIDRSNQYYREIYNQFLACYDLDSNAEGLEIEAITLMDIGQEKQGESGSGTGKEKVQAIGEGCSPLEQMDSDTKSVCSKCGYRTSFQMLFRMHQKKMHAE